MIFPNDETILQVILHVSDIAALAAKLVPAVLPPLPHVACVDHVIFPSRDMPEALVIVPVLCTDTQPVLFT